MPVITFFKGNFSYHSPFSDYFFIRKEWWAYSWGQTNKEHGMLSREGGIRIFGLVFRYIIFVEIK